MLGGLILIPALSYFLLPTPVVAKTAAAKYPRGSPPPRPECPAGGAASSRTQEQT
jgi:hypothetical protein